LRINEPIVSLFTLKLLLIALLFDIGGSFGLKYAAMAFALSVSVYKVLSRGVSQRLWPEALVIFYVLMAGLLSIAAGTPSGSVYNEISFLAFFLLIFLLYGIDPLDITRIFTGAAVLGALMVIVLFMLLLVAPELGGPVADLGHANRLGYLGYRPGFDGLPNVYFRWSVWLVLGLALALASRSVLSVVLVGAAGILTTSTAIIVTLVFVLIGYFIVIERRVQALLVLIMAGGVVAGVAGAGYFMFGHEVAEFVLSKFLAESSSTSTKLGHIQSVFDELRVSWLVAIFGQGIGTSFYSVGVGEEVINIEVSHFNMLRQYGVVGTVVLMTYVAFVIFQVTRCGNLGMAWALGLVGMFFVAATNPLLLSPMFFVPLLMARMIALGCSKGVSYDGR